MKIINISATDDQTFTLQIEGNSYKFRLLDRGTAGIFLDVYRNNEALIMGVACLDRVKIIRSAYKNFPGDLMFVDQLGYDNPSFPYFGTRFLLYQLASNELNVGN